MATLPTHHYTEHTSLWEEGQPSSYGDEHFSLAGITPLEAAVLLEGHASFFCNLKASDSPDGFNMCDVEEALWSVRDEVEDPFAQDVLEAVGKITAWVALILAKRGMYQELNCLNMFRAEAEQLARQLAFQRSYRLS